MRHVTTTPLRRSSHVLLLLGLLTSGACTKHHARPRPVEAPVVTATDTNPWHVLAHEIDDPAARSLCAAMPAEVRTRIEAGLPADLTEASRLDLARARLEALDHAVKRGPFEAMRQWERPALEALCLAEPIVFGATSAAQAEASLLLLAVHDRIDVLAAVREPLDSPVPVPARGDDEAVRTAVDTIRASSPPVRAHLLAVALRSEVPAGQVEASARAGGLLALRAGDGKRGRAIFEALVKVLGGKVSADDWASVALARFATNALEEGDLALNRAQAMARPATEENRQLRARLRTVTRARAVYAELATMPTESLTVEVALRRAGLYSRLDRHGEARGALLTFDASRDGRVAGRMARIVLAESAFRGDWAAAAREADRLLTSAASAPGREGEYMSARLDVDMLLGLLNLLTRSPGEDTSRKGGRRPLLDLVTRLGDDGRALEPFNAGRGAIVRYAFSADGPAMHAVREGDAWITQASGAYDAALALRVQYPASSTAHRLVYGLAPAARDLRAAFEQVAAPPPVDPEDDVDLYLQRARAGLDLAAALRDRALVGKVRGWAEAVPASDGFRAAEVMRASLLAESWALDAALGGPADGFLRAQTAYGRVAADHPLAGPDQTNALFVATHLDSTATLTAQLTALRDAPLAPWPARLNALVALRSDDATLARQLDAMIASESSGGRAPSRTLWAWRAAVASRLGDRAAPRFAAHAVGDGGDLAAHAADSILQEPTVSLPIEMVIGPEGPLLSLLPVVRRAPWLLPPSPLGKNELVSLAARSKR